MLTSSFSAPFSIPAEDAKLLMELSSARTKTGKGVVAHHRPFLIVFGKGENVFALKWSLYCSAISISTVARAFPPSM